VSPATGQGGRRRRVANPVEPGAVRLSARVGPILPTCAGLGEGWGFFQLRCFYEVCAGLVEGGGVFFGAEAVGESWAPGAGCGEAGQLAMLVGFEGLDHGEEAVIGAGVGGGDGWGGACSGQGEEGQG